LVTGASFEEPAATTTVAAGSVVLCGSALSGADACRVAFRAAMDAHFASHTTPGGTAGAEASSRSQDHQGLWEM
jgi:hypothetical protein